MSGERPWRLIRLDDNDNEVEVERFAHGGDAEAARKRFEARGHKQSWFVRNVHGSAWAIAIRRVP